MKVQDVMHKGTTWAAPDTSLEKLARLMRVLDIGAIPIGENDRLIGMVTDRDVCCRGMGKKRDPKLLTARDVMTRPIVYCRDDQKLEDAVAIMRKAKVRRLPVVNDRKRMVGLLSLGDVSSKATARTAASALKALAAHHG